MSDLNFNVDDVLLRNPLNLTWVSQSPACNKVILLSISRNKLDVKLILVSVKYFALTAPHSAYHFWSVGAKVNCPHCLWWKDSAKWFLLIMTLTVPLFLRSCGQWTLFSVPCCWFSWFSWINFPPQECPWSHLVLRSKPVKQLFKWV